MLPFFWQHLGGRAGGRAWGLPGQLDNCPVDRSAIQRLASVELGGTGPPAGGPEHNHIERA